MLDATFAHPDSLGLRRAAPSDREALDHLRRLSLERLMAPTLTEPQRRTLYAYTAFDGRLIGDGTYFVLEIDGRIAASGGWSRRAALVNHRGDDVPPERFLDARHDPAIIRAMYTHPDYSRLGLGSILLAAAEAAARLAGFGRAELIATSAGRELYLARGWRVVRRIALGGDDDSAIEASLMERALRSSARQADAGADSSRLQVTGVSGW